MTKIFPQSNSLEFTENLIKCSTGYKLGAIHKTKFANGEIAVVIEESVRNEIIVIVSQPRNYEDIFELLETIDAARRSSAKEIIGIIPYLPHSRQERRENGVRTTISARLLADTLQVAGLDRIITMDVHTTAIEGFYKIPFDNIDPFEQFITQIKSLKLTNMKIVSPDLGGMKRAKRYAKELGVDIAFLMKERLKANEVAEMTLMGDVEGYDVIIPDDMIDTGGTMLAAIDLLYQKGAKSVRIFVSHGLFSNDAIEKFMANKNCPKVYVTTTLPQKGRVDYHYDKDASAELCPLNVSKEFHNAIRKVI